MNSTFEQTATPCSRRRMLVATASVLIAACSRPALAGPLDSIPMTPGAKILRQGSIVVSGKAGGGPAGFSGADVFSPARAFLDVDFAVRDKADVTLMILSAGQKAQLFAGQRLQGDPMARVPIEGPETANHSVTVRQGNYWVGFLNSGSHNVEITYRVSLRAY